ncbi:hypothetical protein MMC14_010421, partial [Varicellaria rhodocarpa]|nr:hypothetical protein [Varicellaria rhodocarpa]
MVRPGYVSQTFHDPNGPNDAEIIIYGYIPSLALAVIAVVTFALSTLSHIGQVARYKTWFFILFIVGCAIEVVGYVFRSLSSRIDPYSVPYFVVQYFFIVVAPVFFSA